MPDFPRIFGLRVIGLRWREAGFGLALKLFNERRNNEHIYEFE